MKTYLFPPTHTGNIALTLSGHPTQFNVFVSSDGGKTWNEALQKRHLFQFADHGSIMVAVRMMFLHPVNQL